MEFESKFHDIPWYSIVLLWHSTVFLWFNPIIYRTPPYIVKEANGFFWRSQLSQLGQAANDGVQSCPATHFGMAKLVEISRSTKTYMVYLVYNYIVMHQVTWYFNCCFWLLYKPTITAGQCLLSLNQPIAYLLRPKALGTAQMLSRRICNWWDAIHDATCKTKNLHILTLDLPNVCCAFSLSCN